MVVHASADSRYKFYVNGRLVVCGPLKGDRWRKYYESLDVTKYLRPGKNVFAARVLHFNTVEPWRSGRGGLVSQPRSSTGAFLLEGEILDEKGTVGSRLVTDTTWKCLKDGSVEHRSGILYMPNVGETEVVDGSLFPHGWEENGYDDSAWPSAAGVGRGLSPDREAASDIDPWPLTPRTIPLLYEKKRSFTRAVKCEPRMPNLAACLTEKGPEAVLPANRRYVVELDAGEYTTGYPVLTVGGGRGSQIKILYGECYGQPVAGTHQYKKGVRDDTTQELIGEYDLYDCGGLTQERYEPFWFRTFRYIRLEIEVAEKPLTIYGFHYRETGYPLDVESDFRPSDKRFEVFWEISARTLKRCMHETYEDCPYMEQGQYILDARQQALFTYQVSADDRLARKALYDFHSSLMPSGLLQCRFPSIVPGIIPGFSLYWIWMLYDHYRYFGDRNLVRRYLGTMESILGWYERHTGANSLVDWRGYYPFIDWTGAWFLKKSHGLPPAFRHGPLSFHSLFYLYTLREPVRHLLNQMGRLDGVRETQEKAAAISTAVLEHCWSRKDLYFQDGPGINEYSQHSQVMAVLSGVIEGEPAGDLLRRSLKDKMVVPMSHALSFFVFRAFEKMKIYSEAFPLWKKWDRFVALHVTTWPEDEFIERSDCHGWAAVPLYESVAMMLGVQPAEPGYAAIRIDPHPGALTRVAGRVATCRGPIDIRVARQGPVLRVAGKTNFRQPAVLIFPDGRKQTVECDSFSYQGEGIP